MSNSHILSPDTFRVVICSVLLVLVLAIVVLEVNAQSTSVTDGTTPLALQPGAPNGSYALSGFDNVNLFNGSLNFRLALAAIGGRGEVSTSVMMPIERKWRVIDIHLPQPDGSVNHVYTPIASFWKTLPVLYNPGGVEGRHAGSEIITCPDNTNVYAESLTRLTFTTADGTEYELRDTLTNGQPHSNGACNYGTPVSRGTVFVTADGTAATFISDTTIYDQVVAPGNVGFDASGVLMLRDGTKYRVDSGRISWIRDRNGNKITYDYDANDRVITIADPLKRTVNISYAAGATTYDQLTFKGFNGATRTLRVNYAALSTLLQSGTVKTFRQLFPELSGASTITTFNPNVIASLTLPNNQEYQFRYNSYGEVSRVVLPTGGAYEYDYSGGGEYTSGTTCCSMDGGPTIYRVVTERRIYSDGSTGSSYENKMTYTYFAGTPPDVYRVVKHYKQGDVNPVAQQKHYFYGSPISSLGMFPTDYPGWKEGKEYQTDYLTGDGNIVLKREVHSFQQRASVSWWPNALTNSTMEPPNDPRLTQTVTALEPSGQNLVLKMTFGYDDSVPFNNRNNVKVYDFGLGSAGSLLRETRTTYVTSSGYTGASVHLRSLVSQVSIYDASGTERSRTTAEFDNYATDANHATLTNCPNISNFDSTFSTSYLTRGNVTCSTRSILVNGAVTGSVTSCRQFDIAGNAVKSIDSRGFAVTVEYADRFGSPDGEARSNTAPTDLGGLTSYAFATKITNALGQAAYVQFDYNLGNPVDSEDLNGIVTSGYFNEALDRPSQVRRAVGTAIQNQTTFAYDDANRMITTSKDQVTNNDNVLVAKLLYDKLGRTVEERQYESGTNYIAIQTQYDEFGRANKTSKPFRPWQSETPVWTTQAFDALGRVTTVTSPDNSVVTNSYITNALTVTDPKQRKRKVITDGLGRQKQIYEDPDSLNYLTSYGYDIFDNVVSVTQGTQTRTFVYNSLNQLTSATNPENGTTNYQYDNEGNLLVRTDARGVSSHFTYDGLNRIMRRWYNGSNSTTATTHNSPALPAGVGTSNEANFYYDSQSLPGGAPSFSRGASISKQVAVTYGTGSSAGDYFGYDALGRSVLKIQQTGGLNYQSTTAYNLASAATGVTYPSGHTVAYSYDSAGRTSNFSGNLGDGTTRTYASTFVYNPAGQITQELFGTAMPLYHKLQYNIRSQLWDVRVSTSSDINGSWNRGALQFFYDGSLGNGSSGPDNNGNLLMAKTYIPLDDQANAWAISRQSYTYDALNRLTSTTEYFASNTQAESQQSVQSYTYDPWGNRTINFSGTNGTGINNKVFTVNTANNRLGVPGGQSGAMDYDAAGNLINDTYSGAGNRTYDAENRITSAWGGNNQAQLYSYDGRNQRITRTVDGVTTWQVYGTNGDLLAEYSANGAATSPQKEYGYRDGQLLITAEAGGGSGGGGAQNVTWTNAVGVSISGNNLTRTAAGDAWNAGATSSQSIASGDGYVEFTATEANKKRAVGLTDNTSVTGYQHIDFGIHLGDDGQITIHEGISVYGVFGTYTAGDTLRVAIEGGVVKYRKNGTLLRTSTVAPTYPLYAGAALYTNGSTVTNATKSGGGPESVLWTNAVGVSISGNNLTRAAAGDAWNAGATSSQSIASGDGYVEVTATEANKKRAVGLTDNTSVTGYQHIDFGIHLGDDGQITIHEGISVYGVFGTYTAGDTLRVAIEGGVVKYRKNGTLLRTSTLTPTYPLYAGAALYHNGSTVTNAVISSGGGGGSSAHTYWLVADHLGTPRIIIDQTGTLANVKRHDYLPFGEELFAGTGGRAAAQGYSAGDGVRQQFTAQERDFETSLDYFGARHYSSVQGRFTASDPGKLFIGDPQTLNRYSYVKNNPLKFIDPTGRDLYIYGIYADYIVSELEKITGLKLQRDPSTGKVTIVPGSKRNTKGTSTHFANRLAELIGDSRAKVQLRTGSNQPGVFFDRYLTNDLDVADYEAFKKADPKFAAESLAHVIEEYYWEQIIPYAGTTSDPGWRPAGEDRGPLNKLGRFRESHEAGTGFESLVLSDFTGWWEKPMEEGPPTSLPDGSVASTVDFSSVTYLVVHQNFTVISITKYERKKPRKQ